MTSATLNRFGFGILIAGLLAALVLAGASLIPRHPPEEKQRQPSPEELDRLAWYGGPNRYSRIWKRYWRGPSFSPAGPVRRSTASTSIRQRF